jgi:plasmid stabilization system protein ParE
MRLIVDPAVDEAIVAALDYWAVEADSEELIGRLVIGFDVALAVMESEPRRGRRVPGLPEHYRRLRLAPNLPGYVLYYRIEASRVLLYLLRHERQRPYAPATLQRKAGEAARRVGPAEVEDVGGGPAAPAGGGG